MSEQGAIRASGVTKRYRVWSSPWQRIRGLFVPGSSGAREFTALEDVSLTVARGGEQQDALDQPGETAGLLAYDRAVFLKLHLAVYNAICDVVGRRFNHGQRRAQLVRHGRDELHLQAREALRANAGDDEHRQAEDEQKQCAKAQREAATPHVGDEAAERPPAPMSYDELPVVHRRRLAE